MTILNNKITGQFSAIVSGKETAFSGCSNMDCAKNCLRKDSRLLSRSEHNIKNLSNCAFFIINT